MPLMQNLGGGTGDKPSALIEIIKILGPQIGGVVENVTSTVKEAIHAKTNGPSTPPNMQPNYQQSSQMLAPQQQQAVPQQMQQTQQMQQSQQPQQLPKSEKEQEMIFLLSKVRKAINESDINMYPVIQQLIINNVPEATYERIINKEITSDILIQQIKSYIPEVTTISGKTYLENFIDWAKSQEVIGKCTACQVEFTYLNDENLIQNKQCPSCKTGEINKITEQVENLYDGSSY